MMGPMSMPALIETADTGFQTSRLAAGISYRRARERGPSNDFQGRNRFGGNPYGYCSQRRMPLSGDKLRLSLCTFEETDSVDGKVRITRRAQVAPDGKILTVTSKGVNAQGQSVSNVSIYEKQ